MTLSHSFQNPVVFAQPLSTDGDQACVVRLRAVDSDNFSLSVEEAPDLDGGHTQA